jgi:DNA-binding CsgD family transcriptional regulator
MDDRTWKAVARDLGLSPQQKRIVELILRERSDTEIAAALGIGEPTVRTYLTRLYGRFGVRGRLGLVLRVFTATIRELTR